MKIRGIIILNLRNVIQLILKIQKILAVGRTSWSNANVGSIQKSIFIERGTSSDTCNSLNFNSLKEMTIPKKFQMKRGIKIHH